MNYHIFIDEELHRKNLTIINISQAYLTDHMAEIMTFVNGIILEHGKRYGWDALCEEYFLNPMDRKFEYSFLMRDTISNEIALLNFSSIYGNSVHDHCTYVRPKYRNMGLAKLHMIKLCQLGADNGFQVIEGGFPKNNNGSIVLHLKMGWMIHSIKNNNVLTMVSDISDVMDKAYILYVKEHGVGAAI